MEDILMIIPLVISVAFVIVAIVGAIMEKRIRTKYNGAVGLGNSFLFTGGTFGGVFMVLMPFLSTNKDNIAEGIVAGLICVALAGLMLFLAWRKCPAGSNALLPLMVGMYLVGAAAYLRIWGFLMKLVFHFDIFANSNPGAGYANWYQDDAGNQYQLWTNNGTYAVLKAPGGSTFDVHPHGDDGLVCDGSGNLYYPL